MAVSSAKQIDDVHADQRDELLEGLLEPPRSISPKFFYDERGSRLFDEICRLPEYYPTRTEVSIFKQHSESIARAIGAECELLEPGAGACQKVRHLIEDLKPHSYLPLDISGDYLLAAASRLQEDFPRLNVVPLVADLHAEFELPEHCAAGRRVLFYPGSSIGNFTPDDAREFLERAAEMVGAGGGLLIGVDLHKDSAVLRAAYNDSQGVTAEFNRNVLHHANRLLEANFQPGRFEHVALYNEEQRRIEMYLVSRQAQFVQCGDTELEFAASERILTEYSYKYTLRDFSQLAASAGFIPRNTWVDERGWFSVHYLEAAQKRS